MSKQAGKPRRKKEQEGFFVGLTDFQQINRSQFAVALTDGEAAKIMQTHAKAFKQAIGDAIQEIISKHRHEHPAIFSDSQFLFDAMSTTVFFDLRAHPRGKGFVVSYPVRCKQCGGGNDIPVYAPHSPMKKSPSTWHSPDDFFGAKEFESMEESIDFLCEQYAAFGLDADDARKRMAAAAMERFLDSSETSYSPGP